jgi:hypothetical protein
MPTMIGEGGRLWATAKALEHRQSILIAVLLWVLLPSDACAQLPALLLYGGKDHRTFLGCLNCNRYDAGSVWNAYGQYGSQYSSNSIWNRYGTWGSPYSSVSPWNKYSSDAPVIVDKDGNFYGHFSSNAYINNRTQIKYMVWLLDNYDWVIEHLDEVREKIN